MSFAVKRFKGFWNQFKQSKLGIVGVIIIAAFSFVAIFAPFIAPFRPIDPQVGIGQYPAHGSVDGIMIAERLCKPTWYKYVPWVPRGATQVTERFRNQIATRFGQVFQTFGPEDKQNVSDANLILTYRVASIEDVTLILEDGTTRELSYPAEWSRDSFRPREIIIPTLYPNGTTFQVIYNTGVDLVENMKLVEDHTFTSPQSFGEEWTDTTNNANRTSVSYNNEKGFAFRQEETDRGAVQIAYSVVGPTSNQSTAVTLLRSFRYAYQEPPKSFYIHASIKIEGNSEIVLNTLMFKEGEPAQFLLTSSTISTNVTGQDYRHFYYFSPDPVIAKNVGESPPQDKVFASPGNYSFAVQVVIPSEQTTNVTIYLDNLDCVLYGNVFGILGTDNGLPYPRDIFSLLVHGSRVSLIVGVLTAVFSTFIGLFLGLVSGYLGGLTDEGIMRFADLLLVLPTLPLFIVLVVALRAVSGYVSMWNIIIILTFFGWMGFARSVRSMVLSIRERAFIEAARAAGAGKLHIINKHIIPNVFALVYITLATSVPGAIITEASLSWLGLGDPRLASWGKILYDFNVSGVAISKGMLDYWFWIFPACVAIALLATAFILVGYSLDAILNPRLRERR
jgi:ABC-type dipeptide/oligopeptide/nickel transport system permease subunit